MNIYYVAKWQKERQKTWSGTVWGIYTALKKIYTVQDIELPNKKTFCERFLRILHIRRPNFEMRDNKHAEKFCNKILRNDTTTKIIFQFAEIVKDTPQQKTYIYQDLSVDYVWYMYKHLPHIYKLSNFQGLIPKDIERRRSIQNDYYQHHCSGIFTMSKWLANDLITRTKISPSMVHHIGGGINISLSSISDETKRTGNKILFAGRDYKRKGLPITMEAFKLLKKTMPHAEIYVAGPSTNPYKGEVIEGYHFLGDLDSAALSHYFALCDIFCMPSYFEAYGLVFIEALTAGLPCIGRNCYEMPYFIDHGETGYLIEDDNAADLSEKMHALLHDERIKQNVLAKRAYCIEEYSWDAVAKRIEKVIGSYPFPE